MPGAEGKPSYATTAASPPAPASAWGEPDAPIVRERRIKPLNIPNPGLPHANYAPSEAHPYGTTEDGWAEKTKRQTVLEQHVNYWDRDNDGVIWPLDTFRGFRELGYNLLWSLFAMFIIHVNFSFPTWPSWTPDPFFRIYISNIHRTKHGSDTGSFDTEGRYVPQKFDEIFQKFSSSPNRDGLTKGDVFRAIMAQRSVNDFIGLGGEVFEWTTTYILLWPADGVMKYEDVRACMDGSIFWKIARERGVDLKGADPARTTGKH